LALKNKKGTAQLKIFEFQHKKKIVTLFWHSIFCLIPVTLLLLSGILFFSSAGRDDSHITFWAAYSLENFAEILNYNGDRIEQSSSLLYTILLAFISSLSSMDLVSLGVILSILSSILSLFILYRIALKVHKDIAFPSALLTATSAYFIYWAFGGLESTLVSLTSLGLIFTYARYLTVFNKKMHALFCASGTSILFVLIRPESSIVLLCMLFCAVIFYGKMLPSNQKTINHGPDPFPRLLLLLGIGIIICLLVFIFRIYYFGSLFPQPVYAKSSGISWNTFKQGFFYFIGQLFCNPFLAVMTILSAGSFIYSLWNDFHKKYINPYLLFSSLLLIIYIVFIFFSGGDWMEGGRFIVPIIPIAVMFIPYALISITSNKFLFKLIILLLFIIQIITIINFASKKSTGMPLWSGVDYYKTFAREYGASDFSWFERTNRIHVRDIPTIYYLNHIIKKLLTHKNDKIHIMSIQMGMILYHINKQYFGQIHVSDLKSLIDRTFLECNITSDLPRGRFGLELGYSYYFENSEILERECGLSKPDIIFDLFYGKEEWLRCLQSNGYTLIYVQRGKITSNSDWLPGRLVLADQFIAIRNELKGALRGLENKVIKAECLPWAVNIFPRDIN